ncbi:MnhB domain-containing protein [Chryseobacterium pennae]|nr:MnhB domain-containing protein [Chryseobacterium pennae]
MMTKVLIDYSQIHLQENIPLNEEELNRIAIHKRDFYKDFSGVVIAVIMIVMIMAGYFLKNEFKNFKYYHYLLFIGVAVALYLFFLLMHWLLCQYFKGRWKKDIKNGKNRLESIIISKHKTEGDEYIITFAGCHKGKKIRLPVEKTDYDQYEMGAKVVVNYFKYSQEVISLDYFESKD